MAPVGRALENDRDNPCFGCGPRNPRGLHLRFYRQGRGVVSEKIFPASYSGWPGVVAPAMTFQALCCGTWWAVYARARRIGTSIGWRYKITGVARIGATVRVTGRVVRQHASEIVARSEVKEDGRLLGWMEQRVRMSGSRKEFQNAFPDVQMTTAMKRILPP